MATREEAIAELYRRRDQLGDRQRAAVEELAIRMDLIPPASQPGAVVPPASASPTTASPARQQALQEMAEEVGPLQAFMIGAGKGLTNFVRGIAPEDPEARKRFAQTMPLLGEQTEQLLTETPEEQAAMTALKEQRPIATGAGEITGEVAPFLPASGVVGALGALPARAAAGGALGAAEGGILAEDKLEGAGIGAGIGVGAEVLFPVVGRLGRKIFERVAGKSPRGAMLDASGRPTPELQQALDSAGMTFEDLSQDAENLIRNTKPGTRPEQAARAAKFAEEGIPLTKGELTREGSQQALEQRLLQQSEGAAAEPLRQFKLRQSQEIKNRLEEIFPDLPGRTETGEVLQKVLEGKKKLLRTQKNDLYRQSAENAQKVADIPVMPDAMIEALPDDRTMRRLGILDPTGAKQLNEWLMEYGIVDPTQEMVEAGFSPIPLTLDTFEDFRMGLNQISESSDAIKVATGPVKRALDEEGSILVEHLEKQGVPDEVIAPLREARKTVREMKTEFSPQSLVGQLIGTKKDRVTMLTDASQVYDKIARKSVSQEDVGKLVSVLSKSPQGDEAISNLQATVILDLVDAGFGTESRKISGEKVFNPIAFKKRIESLGKEKLQQIFKNNKTALRRINNIESISKDLVPENWTVPKGSAPVIMDLLERLSVGKIPVFGPIIAGTVKNITEPIKTGMSVKKALNASPDIDPQMRTMIDKTFPGLASALGISTITEQQENK